jgi:hypothetical protein
MSKPKFDYHAFNNGDVSIGRSATSVLGGTS